MLFFTLIFSLINVTSALKVLFLDYNVRMLCEFNPFLLIIYAYMVKFTLFICLLQIENTDMYRIPQIIQKILRYEFLLISPIPSFVVF